MGTTIMLLDNGASDPLRLGFSHLFVKRPGKTNNDGTKGKDKYEATLIFERGSPNHEKIKEVTAAVCREAWGEKWEDFYAELGANEKAVRNGNTKVNQSGQVYDGFDGNLYVTARNETRPTVIDRDQSPLVADDGKPFGGCYVNAEIEIWAQKPREGVGRRVNVTLLGVQYVRTGDAFGAGAAPSKPSSFANLSVEDDAPAGDAPKRSSILDD